MKNLVQQGAGARAQAAERAAAGPRASHGPPGPSSHGPPGLSHTTLYNVRTNDSTQSLPGPGRPAPPRPAPPRPPAPPPQQLSTRRV